MFDNVRGNLGLAAVHLVEAACCAMNGDVGTSRERIANAVAALHTDGGATAVPVTSSSGSGLPRWRARQVAAHIREHLATPMRTCDIARVAGLSASHFSHAFKQTFGVPPHAYVMARRMELAQELMLGTHQSLADIAAACGMADQAHLTRCFRSKVGETPHEWRKVRRDALLMRSSN